MRIVDIIERTVPISRYDDSGLPSGGLTTSIVALVTDVIRNDRPIVWYGFSSIGRFGQSGLIRERFAPRLLAATVESIATDDSANLDPYKAWEVMLAGEKPGGHGERCVAVGTLDMACWDVASKIARVPLWQFLAGKLGRDVRADRGVPVYAGGGYYYPQDDTARLSDEIRRMRDAGYTHAKIKIAGGPLARDLERIELASKLLPSSSHLAVDAMNSYGEGEAEKAACALSRFDLWWFEDICDPHDFVTHSAVTAIYESPVAAGEAIFSTAEARLLELHGGLRSDRDILLFDPVHCYGLPGYLKIVTHFERNGWRRERFWPHGGHLFCLHIVKALGLGGAEVNPFCFLPFGGLADGFAVDRGTVGLPEEPGIGFETKKDLASLFSTLK